MDKKSIPDYAWKSEIMSSEGGQYLLQLDRDIQRSAYARQYNDAILEGENLEPKKEKYDFETTNELLDIFGDDETFKEAHRINHATWKRVCHLKHRVQEIVESDTALFVTLTFTDDVLQSTNPKTRRQYVFRYLKAHCDCYVANKDFGAKNGREHYHAIVSTYDSGLNLELWRKYGNINVERVWHKPDDTIKIAKYVSKLTNHAIKCTAQRTALIYSR